MYRTYGHRRTRKGYLHFFRFKIFRINNFLDKVDFANKKQIALSDMTATILCDLSAYFCYFGLLIWEWGDISESSGIRCRLRFRSRHNHFVGTQVKFHLEYIFGKPIATFFNYHNPEESSSGNQSDTYD